MHVDMKDLIRRIKEKLGDSDENICWEEPDGCWICRDPGQEQKQFPRARLHKVYPGLDEAQLMELERLIDRKLPKDLRHFYREANGLSLFYGSLNIHGLIGVGKNQPVSLEYGTVRDRPIENGHFIDDSNQIRFGGFGIDHIDLMVYLDDPRVFAVRRFREGPLYYEWASLASMIESEVERMSALYKESKGGVDPLHPFKATWM